jgi:hypothetical protein
MLTGSAQLENPGSYLFLAPRQIARESVHIFFDCLLIFSNKLLLVDSLLQSC